MYYVFVDAGQTKTRVFLIDDKGNVTDDWIEDPIVPLTKQEGMTRLRHIFNSFRRVLEKKIQIDPTLTPDSICVSLSGYYGENASVPNVIEETIPFGRLYVIPDYIATWYTMTNGKPGISLISGGGTVGYGQNSRHEASRVGGWGHVLGDEGSGYWIGLQALKAALRSFTQIEKAALLEREVRRRFSVNDELSLIRAIYSGQIDDKQIAELVPAIVKLAESGDQHSQRIMYEAVEHLVWVCRTMIAKLGILPIYLAGGVFRSKYVEKCFIHLLQQSLKTELEIHNFSDSKINRLALAKYGVEAFRIR